jgi:hypothetical protein
MFFFHPAPHDHHADIPADHRRPGRSALLVLSLAAITTLGGILAGPVAATSQAAQPDPSRDRWVRIPVGATAELKLTPADGTDEQDEIWLGDSRTYTATVIITVGPNKGAAGNPDRKRISVDVTGLTTFTVMQRGRPPLDCEEATCKPDTAGEHTVKGVAPRWPRGLIEGTSTLRVRQPVKRLQLTPPDETIQAGGNLRYTATGLTGDDQPLRDVTDETSFTVTKADGGPPIACQRAVCAPTAKGDYTVTGTLQEEGRKPVTGTANLTVVPGAPETLRLEPVSATVEVGVGWRFQAIGEDKYGNTMDLTERADLTIARKGSTTADGGSCAKAGDVVTCKGTRPDTTYVVTATLPDSSPSATATLIVLPDPHVIDPSIQTVTSGAASPNTEVVVTGTTGSCNRVGRLTLEGTDVRRDVRDKFTTRFTVPSATPPGDYRLLLDVTCKNNAKQATHDFQVRNRPPEPVDDPDATTLQDQGVSIPVMKNDKDPDDPDGYRTALDPGAPKHGTAVDQKDGQIRYTPDKGFKETDRFQYRLCDVVNAAGKTQCGTATVTVAVNPPEPKPVDDPDEETRRDQSVVIDVMGNDEHPDASRLRVLRPERPGSSAEKLPDGDVAYTPEPGYVGEDTFRYDYCGSAVNAAGPAAACPSATVTVDVKAPGDPEPPEPVDDPDEKTTRDLEVVVDVMGNDRRPDAARLRVKDQPARGVAEKLPDGTVRYTPDKGFADVDRFTYDYCGDAPGVTRRAACPSATVTVTVTSDPVITSIRPGSTGPGKPVKVVGSTGSCDRAGTLTLEETGANVHVTADQRGNFTASLTVPKATAPRTYTLALSVACQGQAQRAEGRVTVTNQAPEAADDVDTTARDHAVEIPVTRNDRDPDDPDGYPTRLLAGPPINGSAEVRSDDTIAYTPSPGFIGQDQFRYSVCDNILNAVGQADCGTANVTVSVTDTPAITSISPASAKPGTPIVVVGSTGSCDRAGTLTLEETGVAVQVAGEQNGNFTTVLTVPDGTYPRVYRLALRVDCNGTSQQAEGTLSVTNEPPQAADDEADTVSDTSVPIEVADNDRDPDDPDGYPSLLLVSGDPDHGTAEVQSERTIVYTPEPGYVGQDQFRYSLCDNTLNAAGAADCGTATVTVTVADGGRCLSGDVSGIRVEPGKGRGGARVGITATVDRRLAACPFRFLLGGTPLGADVRAGDDGGITAQRAVPGDAKPGTIPVRLATMRGQVLAEAPFEIVRPFPWLSNPLVKAVLGVAALLLGGLAQAAFRRWRPTTREPDDAPGPPEDIQTKLQTAPAELAAERVRDGTRTFAVRLEPHRDPGTQRMEADR